MNRRGEILFSIIIPTYNSWDALLKCINAIDNQTISKKSFEVIVVNNAVNDPCPYINLLPQNFQLIEEKKPGSYAARNKAIGIAKGIILGFTDADCIPEPKWLSTAACFFKDKSIDILAGNVVLYSKEDEPNIYEAFDVFEDFRIREWVENDGYAVTANLFVRRPIFDTIGVFRDDLFSGCDMEWTMRATTQGCNLKYANAVVIKHPARDSFFKLLKVRRRRFIGHCELNGILYHPIRKKIKTLLKLFSPPIRLIRMQRYKVLPLRHRVMFFIIRYRIKLVLFHEFLFMIVCGKRKNQER